MAAAGAWLLAGRQPPALMPKVRRAPTVTRSVPSMALFGMAYATASLGCTIAPFLAIVVSAFRSVAPPVRESSCSPRTRLGMDSSSVPHR